MRRRLIVPVVVAAVAFPGVAEAAPPSPSATSTHAAVLGDAPSARVAAVRSAVGSPTAARTATAKPQSPTSTAQAASTPTATSVPSGASRTPGAAPRASLAESAPATGTPTRTPTSQPSPTASPSKTATVAPSPTAQPTASPTVTPSPSPTVVALGRAGGAARGWIEGSVVALDVPARTQFDGTDYQAANCGPASLAMALGAFGLDVTTDRIRQLANHLQGTYARDAGIALPYLARIATDTGLRSVGLDRHWSVDDVRTEVRQGHPVVTLVKLRELPDHSGRATDTDHYVIVVGLEGESLLVNDPALAGQNGARRPLTAAQLERAWASSSIPRHAVAFAAAEGVPELRLPEPPSPTPSAPQMAAPPPLPTAAAQVAPPPTAPGPQPAGPQAVIQTQAGPVVVVVTPAPPPVIVINLAPPQMPPPTATPSPTTTPIVDRWARPEIPRILPAARPAAAVSTDDVPRLPAGEDALVLGEATVLRPDLPLRWAVRAGLFAVAGAALRRILR